MFLRYLYLTYHTSERQSGDFHASSQGHISTKFFLRKIEKHNIFTRE